MKFHVANCPAMFKGVGVDLDYVRPGICIYGLPPGELTDRPFVVIGTRSSVIYVIFFLESLSLLPKSVLGRCLLLYTEIDCWCFIRAVLHMETNRHYQIFSMITYLCTP